MTTIEVKCDSEPLEYEDPLKFFRRESGEGNNISLLLESRRKELTHGTKTVAVTRPAVQFVGKGDCFEVRALNDAGKSVVGMLAENEFGNAEVHCLEDRIEGRIERGKRSVSEDLRIKQPSLATVLRNLMRMLHCPDADIGFYGAISYDFVRQYENLGKRFSNDGGPDINLFLPGELVIFDELKQIGTKKTYQFDGRREEAKAVNSPLRAAQGVVSKKKADMSDSDFLKATEEIIRHIRKGEIIQAVLSRTEYEAVQQHPIENYAVLRELNPSPYSFYLNLGNGEALFGASPELHARIDHGKVEVRPLAGTRRRTGNPIDNFYAKMNLLGDEKELREHRMLVDLARNDLNRICKDAEIIRYMDTIEFPNLFHIGSCVTGQLDRGFDGLDAVVATLPAGTLSGAPKVRAMQILEQLEGSRRGYYGGCVGAFYLNGDCNTAITIRSVYVKDGTAHLRSGAGIVALSVPENELQEIMLKNENQRRAVVAK